MRMGMQEIVGGQGDPAVRTGSVFTGTGMDALAFKTGIVDMCTVNFDLGIKMRHVYACEPAQPQRKRILDAHPELEHLFEYAAD